jgi:16S rRNA G966 N2-methylase RsmD
MSPSTPPSINLSPAAPDYYADSDTGTAFFDGVFIKSDSIKYSDTDRVLSVSEEEQIFMCRQMSGRLKPGLSVLDVGTGSGVLGIWAARHGCKVVAVDINTRALDMARDNAKYNNIKISESIEALTEGSIFFLEKRFEEGFDLGKFDIILLNPPYNPTYSEIKPATHAEAGEDGQKAFNEQIALVPKILKQGGYCIGNQMTTVKNGSLTSLNTISESFENRCNISYTRIIREDINTKNFLKQQYYSYLQQGGIGEFIVKSSALYEKLSLVYYEISQSNTDLETIEFQHKQLLRAGWNDRISLHRAIVDNI